MADQESDFLPLMQRVRAGDTAAFAELLDRYGSAIRLAVRRKLHDRLRAQYDSLDFVQDVWASFVALPADRYAFADPAALVAFLTRVAHHKVVEVFRRRFATEGSDITRERPLGNGDAPIPARLATPSQYAVAGEKWGDLLARVPAGHRPIVEKLRDGYTHQEIADLLGVSPSTIKRIVRRLKDVTGV